MSFINDPDHFDQHFLIDNQVIVNLLKAANIDSNDIIVEVGPGNGTITKLLAKKAKKIYCIEIDLRLKEYLDEICHNNHNVEVIYANALGIEFPKCNKIITSLPYSIIEPFMTKMITTSFDELIMITGNRYASTVANKEVSYLSLLTNCFFDFEKVMEIKPDSFKPMPRTLSAMIKIKHKDNCHDGIYSFFKNMYLLNHKKIKNGLIESLINTEYCSTQREAREIIGKMNLAIDLLETKFEACSNNQLMELYQAILKIYDGKN